MKKIVALLLVLALFSCAAAIADDAEPGLLRVAVQYDIATMDVAETTDNYLIPMNVFDRLFETRPSGDSSEVVKSLVADYSVSEDGLTYSFTLRDGIVFSNGSALTASDVQYSFERLLKAGKMNRDIPLEVLGAQAVTDGTADTLEGFSITDDTHFSITLAEPNAGFPAELTSPAMSILDAETMANAKGFGMDVNETVGTGPYIVTEWVSNDHYTLVYNDKYWGREPSVKKLIVRVIADESTQNLMFQKGELDILDMQYLDSTVIAGTYKSNPAYRIVSMPRVGMTYLIMNEDNQYLKDVRVRKAVGMAIDADLIIKGVFMDDALREKGIIPSGVWAHNDALEGFTYDPEGAKALLQEAGYAEGEVSFEISMNSTDDTGSTKLVCTAISQQLKKVGINASIVSHEESEWKALRSSGKMDSFVARWGMDYNDPANIMYTFFGSEENTKIRSLNYADADTIARVAAARYIVDDAKREEEYRALEEKLIMEDAAWVPLYAELHLWCLGDRVESFTPQWAGFGDFFASDVTLK